MNAANHSLRCVRRKEDPLAAAAEVVSSGAGSVRGGKVTALKTAANAAWTGFSVAGEFISHVLVNPCNLDSTQVDTGATYCIKATDSPGTASMGYERIAVGHIIAWTPGDGTEVVSGAAGTYYDGYVFPNAGLNGAVMTARVAPAP